MGQSHLLGTLPEKAAPDEDENDGRCERRDERNDNREDELRSRVDDRPTQPDDCQAKKPRTTPNAIPTAAPPFNVGSDLKNQTIKSNHDRPPAITVRNT